MARRVHFFGYTKDLKLPETTVKYTVKSLDGRCEVTLNTRQLAKDVFVQIPIQGARFSDNFFDLLPGETKKITITSPEIRKGDKPEITIKHIRETY